MINRIIQMLSVDNFYGFSENIDIAKGKFAYTTSFRKMTRQERRKLIAKQRTNG